MNDETPGEGARAAVAPRPPVRPGCKKSRRGRAAGAALGILLALLPAGRAAAQRANSVYGTGAPIYQDNLDAAVGGLTSALDALEQAGWLLRGSLTSVVQVSPGFHARINGPNSFRPGPATADTEELDLVLGRRLWKGAELIVIPSLLRGHGLSNALGVAQYTNGLAASRDRVWDAYVSHAFIRQTIDLSYDAFGGDSDPTRFAGPLAAERITLTAGRVSVLDFFDTNRYAVDPGSQFLNGGLFASAAFPSAADPRGGTNGVVAEYENRRWALRLGAFQVSRDIAAGSLDPQPLKHQQVVAEADRFWWAGQRPGAVRLVGGLTRFSTRRWDELTRALLDEAPEPAARARSQPMAAANAEQAVTDAVGIFARTAWNGAQVRNWMFTEADWSASAGLSIAGNAWGRFDDMLGLGAGIAGLSPGHRRYLAAGGTGSVLGDGALQYRPEKVLEAYYAVQVAPGAALTVDYQLIAAPGHNAARGPASVFSLRTNLSF
ncbi:carbohydrate porin [Pararoseomonas indoligenes]|uniref:Carbohydrate porin n=1 Tax=Roseomonas indoligenes TaxID=2820811 RepID=A0A940N0D3_9PROT|nr:carbohydrate porin [Pararoseomonas indoligenes]